MITLPTTKILASPLPPHCLILYGLPKVGKTSIIASLPDCLLLDLESGSDYVSAMKLKITSIAELDETCTAIKAAKNPYKFIAVDTVDKLEEWCEDEGTRLYKATPIGKNYKEKSVLELPNGAGYYWLRVAFLKYFNLIRSLAEWTIFIGHVRDKMLTVDGKEVSTKSLDLTGKISNIVCSSADAIGLLRRDHTGTLSVNFSTRDFVTCGSRVSHLINQEFKFTKPVATLDDWKQIYLNII